MSRITTQQIELVRARLEARLADVRTKAEGTSQQSFFYTGMMVAYEGALDALSFYTSGTGTEAPAQTRPRHGEKGTPEDEHECGGIGA